MQVLLSTPLSFIPANNSPMPAPAPAATVSTSKDLSPAAGLLLADLTSLRDLIARRLVQDGPTIAEPDLNHTILNSILRVLFLRFGQDCGFAEQGTLALLAESDGIGLRLMRACSDAGLDPDALLEPSQYGSRPLPAVTDDVLRAMIREFNSPDFPVPLSTIQLHELAAVFEYYLGTTMRVTEGYRVKPEGKSVVRYTGSIHVTAQPVVDSMVRATITNHNRNNSNNSGGAIRILDPACGAGIFLLAAYRILVQKQEGSAGIPDIPATDHLEILSRSVFGTDIDPEAIAVARFILLLAVLKECKKFGPGPASTGRIREITSCLRTNIRCGNALIAPDYFSGRQEHPFNAEERRKVNAFSWEAAFPEILAGGGFDAVIGAPPPYRPFTVKARDEYFQTHYDVYAKGAGLYSFFIEKGLHLLRHGGSQALCIPDTFLRENHARPLRRFLLLHQILEIADTGQLRMLDGGEVRIFALRIAKSPVSQPVTVSMIDGKQDRITALSLASRRFAIDQRTLGDGGWKLEDKRAAAIKGKLLQIGTPLDHYVMGEFKNGTYRIRNNALVMNAETRKSLAGKDQRCMRFFVPLLRPADILRYVPEKPDRFVITAKDSRDLRQCRKVWKYLSSVTEKPADDSGREESRESRGVPAMPHIQDPDLVQNVPKIIFAPYQHCPAFTYDHDGWYAISAGLAAIPRKDPYLAAILNSSLGRFLITSICTLTDRGYHISPVQLGKFPVITPDFDKLADKIRHDKIVALVTQILSLHDYLQKAKTDQEKRLVHQEIETTDVKIDALVYDLYGLTAEEIAVIEEIPR
jgi:hypothetical protein